MSQRFVDETPFSERRRRESRPAQPEPPYYGRGTGVCCHTFCSRPIWERHPNLLLCQGHALDTWLTIAADELATEGDWPKIPRPAIKIKPAEWLYYLRIGEYIKIGYTTDLPRRMRSYPPNAELLAAQPGEMREEAELHDRFREYRAAGREWYMPELPLLDHIAGVIAEQGPPPKLFGRRRSRAGVPAPMQRSA